MSSSSSFPPDHRNDDGQAAVDDSNNNNDNNARDAEEAEGPRYVAVLEPTGRSALELYGENAKQQEIIITLLSRQWPEWRQKVSKFVRFNPIFEHVVFFLIVLNALTIVLDSVVEGTLKPTDNLKTLEVWVDVLDNLVTWTFVIEMVMRWIAVGFWSSGAGYFGSFGNWVDFVINVFSIYSSIQEIVSSIGLGAAASAVRSVRLLRTFRAVKALRNLRTLVDALFVALRRLADVGIIYAIFILFMMTIGLQLFRHRYGRNCVFPVENASSVIMPNGTISSSVVHTSYSPFDNRTIYWTTTSADGQISAQICEKGMPVDIAEYVAALPQNTNYTWSEPFDEVNRLITGYVCPYGSFCKYGLPNPERGLVHFDSLFFAFESLVTVSVFENWDVIMYEAMYARGYAAAWYFETVAFFGSIFVLNLVLAILTDAFTQSLSIFKKSLNEADVEREALLVQNTMSAVGNNSIAAAAAAVSNNSIPHLAISSPSFHGGGGGGSGLEGGYDDDDGVSYELPEISRSRYRSFSEGPMTGRDVVPGELERRRRAESYSVVTELRSRVRNTALALEPGTLTDEQIDDSLDWMRNEWAVVVLEAARTEDLATVAATTLHESDEMNTTFMQRFGWCIGRFKRLQSWLLQNVVATKAFNATGFVLTVINVIILSIKYPKMEQGVQDALGGLSITVAMLFVAESVVRLVSMGWKTLCRDPFNVVDGILAFLSLFELFFAGSTAVSAIRTVRLLRLMSYFPSVIAALRTLAAALKAGASLLVQLFIMIFVMAVLGQQLFRGKLCGLDSEPPFLASVPTKLCPGDTAPAFNFDNLASSVITVFVVVAGDGWRQYWTECSYRTSEYHSLFFIIIYVGGNYLFVNLFVAVLIDAANQSRAAAEVENKITPVPGNQENLENIASSTNADGGAENDNSLSAPLNARGGISSSGSGGGRDADADHGGSDHQQQSCTVRRDDDTTENNSSNDGADTSHLVSSSSEQAGNDDAELNCVQRLHKKYVSHEVRAKAATIVINPFFKSVVAVSSFTASISYLFLAKATQYPDHWSSQFLDWVEVVAAIISTADSVLRYIALRRTCSYLLQFINLCSYFTVFFTFVPIPSRSIVIAVLRVCTRALRPWTYGLRFARFRLVFFSLTRAVSALRSVGAIALLVWFTYGVLGAQLFCGKLSACTQGRLEGDWGDQSYTGQRIMNETACLAANFTWKPYKYNYDNVGAGMLSLVTAATTDDWSNTMYLTTGITEEGVAPMPGRTLAYSVFMCSFVVALAFFLVNVIISVIVDAFFTTKKQMEDDASKLSDEKQREQQLAALADDDHHQRYGSGGGGSKRTNVSFNVGCSGELDVLTSNQKDYYDLALHALLMVKPTMPVNFGKESWRWKIRSIIRSRYFNYIYLGIALLDFVLQATDFSQGRPISGWALLHFDTALASFLMVMTLMRIVGNSFWGFLQESSNLMEIIVNATILVADIAETISFVMLYKETLNDGTAAANRPIADAFEHFQAVQAAGVILGVLRNLRILRFQRVLNTFHGVRVIVFTLRNSLRNFFGGIAIVFLVYYFYASLGLALFGRVAFNGSGLTPNNNFDTIPFGIITLIRVGTLDDWEAVLRASSIRVFPCDFHLGNCGTPFLAYPFFYSFIVFGQWVTMSSFVAILLEAFSQADRRDRFAIQRKDVDRFRKLWKMFADPRTQLLSVAKLPLMLQRLGSAFAVEEDGYVSSVAIGDAHKSGFFTSSSNESSPSPPSSPGNSRRTTNENDLGQQLDTVRGDGNQEPTSPADGDRPDAFGSPTTRSTAGGDGDFDDVTAGNEFDRAALILSGVDRSKLTTRFCSLRRAQQFARELRLHARESQSFLGVVTQMQVFESCVKHHYEVPLPMSYRLDLERQFERTFPLDIRSLASEAGATAAAAGKNAQAVTNFDMSSTDDLLQLIRLQAWWRGQKFRRVVDQAIQARKEARGDGQSSIAVAGIISPTSSSDSNSNSKAPSPAAVQSTSEAIANLTKSAESTSRMGQHPQQQQSPDKHTVPKRKSPPTPPAPPSLPAVVETAAATTSDQERKRSSDMHESYKQRLVALLTRYDPDHVSKADALLSKYVGKEEQFIKTFEKKLTNKHSRSGAAAAMEEQGDDDGHGEQHEVQGSTAAVAEHDDDDDVPPPAPDL